MTYIPTHADLESDNELSSKLLLYTKNKFCSDQEKNKHFFSEDHYTIAWENFCSELVRGQEFQVLKRCYPQLIFPIREGINKEQIYTDAVLRGKKVKLEDNLILNEPESIKIMLYESVSGKVPVIVIPNDQDFEQFVQCMLYKNNPISVPQSMGALLLNGVNNWERIHHLKSSWQIENPIAEWGNEFKKSILPKPALFKDRIIILSSKFYSNVPANKVNMSELSWRLLSHLIRLEHECTHLYTLKKYGFASNNLHDELIADYIGIAKACGGYNKEWMLAFMGLENYPKYTRGARLENYLGYIENDSKDFRNLTKIVRNAIENIAIFDDHLGKINSPKDQTLRIDTLCETNLIDISSRNGSSILINKYGSLLRGS